MRVIIIGAGNMGSSICGALVSSQEFSSKKIFVVNPGKAKRDFVSQKYNVETFERLSDAPKSEIVILAVKPQIIKEVSLELSQRNDLHESLFVSVAAGVTTNTLEKLLTGSNCLSSNGARVIRVMPNTPLTCGSGMSAISAGKYATESDIAMVYNIFSCVGDAVVVNESLQDAVCAISGSGPAYFELFLQVIVKTGVELGLEEKIAKQLALQTMKGTADMLLLSGQNFDEAIEAVSSPGGTTVAALSEFKRLNFEASVSSGIKAAMRRSQELGE